MEMNNYSNFSDKETLLEYYIDYGCVRQANENYYGAVFCFTKAIEVSPNFAESHLRRGIVRGILKDFTGAVSDFSKAIFINPAYAEAYFNRGLLWQRSGININALEDFLKVIEIDPGYSGVYIFIGDIYWKQKEYASAVKYYTNAIEFEPLSMSAYYKRAHAKRILMDYDGALEDFNKFIMLNPNVGQISLTKAIRKLFKKEIKEEKFNFSSLN
jgi:tetratricopeptide (TPR) repeat protein